MHAATLIKILLQPSHNFLSHLPVPVFQRIRGYMKHAIMCTDPASHTEHMANWTIHASEWKQQAQHARTGDMGAYGLKTEAFLSMIGMLLKCADIMHMSQDFECHRRWVEALTEEFYQQGDRETALGMPALPFMQRSKANCLPSSQVLSVNSTTPWHVYCIHVIRQLAQTM
jgi:3'5'-cyclic nucleotide phosphodiesterase